MPDLVTAFALIGLVLTLSALASGVVDRAPLSFPMIFLGLGFLIGERGLGLLSIGPDDPTLEAVALISLSFVLFLDAVRLRLEELGKDWFLPMLVLGPGTFLTIGLIALAAWLVVGATPLQALLLGAILSSTDPVVLRDVLRDRRVPHSIRQTLAVEAGTNDVVVLPVVLVLAAVASTQAGGAEEWTGFLARLLLLGPLVGFAVGAVGSWLMSKADARYGVRREFQALYGAGLVLVAYAAGVAVGGDGFLAAFAAGMAVVVLNFSLCDCFLEYGDTTAEMAMLFAFVLFGAVLSELLAEVALGPALLLAALAIVVARPLATMLVLRGGRVSGTARAFIGWFGPRGLSSLLLALLVVRAGVPQGEWLLAVSGVVVLVSVIVHGMSATPLTAWYGRRVAATTLPEEREATAAGLLGQDGDDVPRVTPAELAARLAGENPPVVLDVRSRSSYAADGAYIPGDVRVLPDEVAEWAADQTRERSIVAYCT